ncbi:class II heat shock protein [Tanacetum coccineum]
MDEYTVRLWLKDHQDAAEKLVRQQTEAFQLQLDTLRAELQETRGLLQNRQGGGGDQGLLLPRAMHLNVLKFLGDDLDRWILAITEFMESVKSHFGPSKYEDPQGALSKLLQLGTVEDYQRVFEKLINRVTDIPDSLLISFYISGLKLNLQHELLVSRPTTLSDAFSLACITEARFEVIAEKKQNIKEKADTTLSLPIEEVSPVVKGLLDASEDTLPSLRSEDPNYKIQEKAVEYVRALNVAPLKVVRDKFAEFFEDKGSVEKVPSATKLPKCGNSHSAYSLYHLKDKVNFECYALGSGSQKEEKSEVLCPRFRLYFQQGEQEFQSDKKIESKIDRGQEGEQDGAADGDGKRKHLFAEVGEIAHVYMARKVTNAGRRFGFAHFFRVGNLQALANRLNRIIIGSFNLRANIARFQNTLDGKPFVIHSVTELQEIWSLFNDPNLLMWALKLEPGTISPVADDIPAEKGSVETEVVDESSFPAQVHVKDNLNFELKLDYSFVKDEE